MLQLYDNKVLTNYLDVKDFPRSLTVFRIIEYNIKYTFLNFYIQQLLRFTDHV
jgi:hypothetical protein